MNANIVDYPKDIQELLIQDCKNFYNISISKNDLERYIRKCLRDQNFWIFNKYSVTFKIKSSLFDYNSIKLLNFNVSKPLFSSSLSFSLGNKMKDNEKIQNSVMSYLKKIEQIISDNEKNGEYDKDLIQLLPQICEVNFYQNQNILNWFKFCSLKEYNNISNEIVELSKNVFEQLVCEIPFIFNQMTYKVFLKVKRD